MDKIGIIGGGASGMIAAIEAAKRGKKVIIFEKKDRIGKKLLATGNGRCNFTNKYMSENYYYTDNPDFIKNTYEVFGNNDLINYMRGLGLIVKDKNGYIYPYSEQASTVLDSLRNEINELEIEVLTEKNVISVTKINKGFALHFSDSDEIIVDKLVVSCGGNSSLSQKEQYNGIKLLNDLNIKTSKIFPALTQIICKDINFKALQGVKSDCVLHVFENDNLIMTEQGEVLFTDYGLSGIVTFQVSHLVNELLFEKKKVSLVVDLLPGLTYEEFKELLEQRLVLLSNRTIADYLTGIHNKKINLEIIKLIGLKPDDSVSLINKDELVEALMLYKELVITVQSTKGFENSQVMGGGVLTSELKNTFETKSVENLFVTGELINVDGICGGYNLQWAFSSGFIAGNNI